MRLFRKKEEEDKNPDLSERIELPGGVSYKKKDCVRVLKILRDKRLTWDADFINNPTVSCLHVPQEQRQTCTFLLRAFREQIFMGMNNFADLDKMCSSLRRYRESNAPIVKGGIVKLIDDDEDDD